MAVASDVNICLLFFLLNSMRHSYPDGASVSKKSKQQMLMFTLWQL